MTTSTRKDRAWLLATARAVADELKARSRGTRLRIRDPWAATFMETDGWRAVIGHLGTSDLRLEIWFDRFFGLQERKLYACFRSTAPSTLTAITKRVSRTLCPHRTISENDTVDGKVRVVKDPLKRKGFNLPIFEKYSTGTCFFGIVDPTRGSTSRVNPHFRHRAAAFFESVARTLPGATPEADEHEVFAKIENRKWVASHLQRERSRILATERKIRDQYTCQACGFRFEHAYGSLGRGFAEAHHLVPLSKLSKRTRTHIDDLVTVCANCHRMLHKMNGRRDDLAKLKRWVHRHQ